MISGKTARIRRPILYLALAAICFLPQGCGSGEGGGVRQGTVNVEGLKVGVPESIIKDAVLTFVLDEKVSAKTGGRNQYLSRTKDSKGGQFSAQCRNGNCFRLEAIYAEPITKAQALETLTKMLPTAAGAPVLRASDDKTTAEGVEKYDCGDAFVGEFILVEPKSEKVRLVAAVDMTRVKIDKAKAAGEKTEGATEEPKTDTKTEGAAEEPKTDTKTE